MLLQPKMKLALTSTLRRNACTAKKNVDIFIITPKTMTISMLFHSKWGITDNDDLEPSNTLSEWLCQSTDNLPHVDLRGSLLRSLQDVANDGTLVDVSRDHYHAIADSDTPMKNPWWLLALNVVPRCACSCPSGRMNRKSPVKKFGGMDNPLNSPAYE